MKLGLHLTGKYSLSEKVVVIFIVVVDVGGGGGDYTVDYDNVDDYKFPVCFLER